jgi:hypothetical protein
VVRQRRRAEMARVLGMPNYVFMVIPHPISSAADEALRRMAEATATRLHAMLLRGPEQKLG